jgi:polyisoprenoid-binding protein YceI
MKTFVLAAALFTVAAATQAQSATYAIDPTHTFVSFEIGHFGTSTNRGRWDKKEGTVQFDRAGKTGKVDITLDMNSLNTGVPPFDGHLKSAEFFNVAQHPTGRFVSDRFVFSGDKVTEVKGTLTLLGKSNPVSLKATNFNCYNSPMLKREVCGGDFEATILRSQFGLGAYEAVAPDQVRVLVQIEAIRQ